MRHVVHLTGEAAAVPDETPTQKREREARQYDADVLKGAATNHIWLNAFACISPTDEFCVTLGRQIIRMLEAHENTHTSEPGRWLGLDHMRELIVRINKS